MLKIKFWNRDAKSTTARLAVSTGVHHTWTGVCEEADQQRHIVHGVQVGPDILNAAGQLGPVAHVVLQHGVGEGAAGLAVQAAGGGGEAPFCYNKNFPFYLLKRCIRSRSHLKKGGFGSRLRPIQKSAPAPT